MENLIKNKLKELEKQLKIEILYACETGSRAWGFPSPDSDYDVRLIYRRELDWYLSLSDKKDSIEWMSDDGTFDFTGWDIKKCLKLMWKSNGAFMERVQSPIVYIEQGNIAAELKWYVDQCFSPIATMHHYQGMARTSFADVEGKEVLKLKKFFYALRATLACKWILEKGTVPPIVFKTMVDELDFDLTLKQRIFELVELKASKNEDYMHPYEGNLCTFIREELNKAADLRPGLKGRKAKQVDLDSLFRKWIK